MDRLDVQHGSCRGTRARAHRADLACEMPRAASTCQAPTALRRVARFHLAVAILFLALFPTGCGHLCLTTRQGASPCSMVRGDAVWGPHVEIIRGLGGYMPGVGELQERLAACGISSTVSCGNESHCIARRSLARRRAGNCCPIVLMAYATGGHATKVIADDLAAHGLRVDAVILLETSFFEPVPSNVRYCFVAYKPEPLQQWNPIMRGLPVQVASPSTRVNLVNLEQIDPGNRLDEVNHLTITTDPWVQQVLVRQAVGVFRGWW